MLRDRGTGHQFPLSLRLFRARASLGGEEAAAEGGWRVCCGRDGEGELATALCSPMRHGSVPMGASPWRRAWIPMHLGIGMAMGPRAILRRPEGAGKGGRGREVADGALRSGRWSRGKLRGKGHRGRQEHEDHEENGQNKKRQRRGIPEVSAPGVWRRSAVDGAWLRVGWEPRHCAGFSEELLITRCPLREKEISQKIFWRDFRRRATHRGHGGNGKGLWRKGLERLGAGGRCGGRGGGHCQRSARNNCC